MKSPGLSSAPAVAKEVVRILEGHGDLPAAKTDYRDGRTRVRFKELPPEEKAKLIARNPAYGRVICRCETITEGEIVDALHSRDPAAHHRRRQAPLQRRDGPLPGRLLRAPGAGAHQPRRGASTRWTSCRTRQAATSYCAKPSRRGPTMMLIWSSSAAALQALPRPAARGSTALRGILILERDNELGGILNQCIHNGFGLHRFQRGAHRPGVRRALY